MPSRTRGAGGLRPAPSKLRHAYAGAIDLPELSAVEFALYLGVPCCPMRPMSAANQEPPMSMLVLLHARPA